MPVVQRVDLTEPVGDDDEKKAKKPKVIGWADAHTQLSGGQVRQIVKLHHQYILKPDLGDRDEIGWQWAVMLLLTEAWSFKDPDHPETDLPKSTEGLEKANQSDITALWRILQPLVETAFPNI